MHCNVYVQTAERIVNVGLSLKNPGGTVELIGAGKWLCNPLPSLKLLSTVKGRRGTQQEGM